MYGFILEYWGFNINKKIVANIVDYAFPWIILLIAILWQVLPQQNPYKLIISFLFIAP